MSINFRQPQSINAIRFSSTLVWTMVNSMITTITGVSPLALANALAKPLRSLVQYGKCVQDGTPTPSSPVDIMCNNGALRYGAVGKNLFDISSATRYRSSPSGNGSLTNSFTATSVSSAAQTYGMAVTPNTTYTISKTGGNRLAIGGFRSITVPVGSSVSANYSFSGVDNFDSVTFTTPSDCVWILACFKNYNPSFDDATNIQLELGSTATAYEPFVGGVVAVGTPEVLTVSADGAATQTVTNLPMLLSVGNFKDELDIVSGIKTGKIGIKVFDGTESFGKSSAYGAAFYIQSAASAWGAQKAIVMSSHYLGLATASSAAAEDTCFFNASGHFYFRVADNSDTAAFKAWLAAQYAAGTPVIVVYPLATPVTEQTTPHALHSYAGDTTVSWVAAVSGTEKTVEYAQGETASHTVGTAIVGTAQAA